MAQMFPVQTATTGSNDTSFYAHSASTVCVLYIMKWPSYSSGDSSGTERTNIGIAVFGNKAK